MLTTQLGLTMASSTAGRREWTALAVLCLPLLIVSMDVSVLFFAVPQHRGCPRADRHADVVDLRHLRLRPGRPASDHGQRRGPHRSSTAAAAWRGGLRRSLGARGLRAERRVAHLARALLGVGGSTLMPSTLAIIRNVFADPARARQGGRSVVGRPGRRRRTRPGRRRFPPRALLVGLGLPHQRAVHAAPARHRSRAAPRVPQRGGTGRPAQLAPVPRGDPSAHPCAQGVRG